MDEPGPGETLVPDPAAYDCLHPLSLEWPCPSFDFLEPARPGPGRAGPPPRRGFPFAADLVVGTQVCGACIMIMMMMIMMIMGGWGLRNRGGREGGGGDRGGRGGGVGEERGTEKGGREREGGD